MVRNYIINRLLSDNSVIATYRLLSLLNLRLPHTEIKEKILEHPNHGSLVAIYDTLVELDCQPEVFIVEEKDLLNNFSFPFIAHVEENKSPTFVVIKKK